MQQLFNPSPPYTMMLDINSCFATLEQQANPLIRGKPVVVSAYTTNKGFILAASIEAKKLGIKTLMSVGEAKHIYPRVVVLPPDPAKYRFINKALFTLLNSYTDAITIKSIDEMAMDLRNTSSMSHSGGRRPIESHGDPIAALQDDIASRMIEIAKEIKQRIRTEIGEWISVSIGIAPNQYLAKVASSYQKPDGLTVITGETIVPMLQSMKLEDLCGIKQGNGNRLRRHGITTPLAFYQAPASLLKQAFQSKVGYDWWTRLHGWETTGNAWDSWGASSDDVGATKTIGHSYALPVAYLPADTRLHQILCQLTEKMARRMRRHEFATQGIHVGCSYADGTFWGHAEKQFAPLFAGGDMYAVAKRILLSAPTRPVRILAVTSYALNTHLYAQQSLFADGQKKECVTEAIDAIDKRWGEFTLFPGRMLAMEQKVLDRIAFGGGKELMRATK